jgi:hypothetical protein
MILVHSVLWVALCCAGLALLVLTDRFAAALMGLKAGEIVQGVCWVWVSWKHSSPVPLDLLCVCCSGHPGSTTLLCIALGTLEAAPAVPLALLCCSGYVGSTALLCPWLCCVLLWVPWKHGSPVPLALLCAALGTLEARLSCALALLCAALGTLEAGSVCSPGSALFCSGYPGSTALLCVTCTALLCVTRTVCVLHAQLSCVCYMHSSPVCYTHCVCVTRTVCVTCYMHSSPVCYLEAQLSCVLHALCFQALPARM